MMKGILSILFCTALSVTLLSQDKAAEIEKLLQRYHDYGQFNGSVLVSHEGQTVFKGGFGMANMEWDIPNTATTKHRLGSITKQFTGLLILKLAEKGKIDLHKPISYYLPDYPNPYGDQITTHHLLTHTSGIPNYTNFPDFGEKYMKEYYSPKDFITEFWDMELNFKPGTQFSYSNSGYFLLGVLIEELSGMTYEEFLEKEIFAPLKMTNSGYDHHSEIIKNRATGYEMEGGKLINSPYLDMSIPYAAGSLYSTAEDLLKWHKGLFGTKLLPKQLIELYFTPQIAAWDGAYYAYGFALGNEPVGNEGDSIYVHSHGGGINGFNTYISRAPKDKSVIILLNNTGGTALEAMTHGIRGILAGKSYDLPRKSVAHALGEVIDSEGIQAGEEFFNSITDLDGYYLSEREMNSMGYMYLQAGQLDEALAVFKMNLDSHRESSNVYDSYAEALMMLGRKKEAIKNYKISVEMNPMNENGISMLEKLGEDVSEYRTSIELTPEQMKVYHGEYELMPGFTLTVFTENGGLMAQGTGQPPFAINASEEHTFLVPEVQARIVFQVSESGETESLTLYQNGQEMLGSKISE